MQGYDPRSYWNAKAKKFNSELTLAACSADPYANLCMHNAQDWALNATVRDLGKMTDFSGQKILDFGCGTGRWSSFFSELGAEYVGVDISDEMVNICRQEHPGLEFEVMDGMKIPTESECFDFVFSIAVLHHNRVEQQRELLAEISRVLKPGGYLFLFEGVGTSTTEREFPNLMEEWEAMVRALGYECLCRRRYEYFPLTKFAEKLTNWFGVGFPIRWRFMRLDALLSPYLSSVLSTKDSGRATLLFQRTSPASVS